MKKLFALGAATLLAFGLASCGEATQQPTEPGTQPAVGKKIDLIYSGTLSNKDFNMGLFEDFKAAMKAAGDPNEYNITYEAHGPDMVDSEVVDWSVGPDVYEFASDKLFGKSIKIILDDSVEKEKIEDIESVDFIPQIKTKEENELSDKTSKL